MSDHKKYNIQHRKTRKTTMFYDEQLSWISRNIDRSAFKSEAEFICHLLSLGIQQYQREAASDEHDRD